jgi:hypothetical protein
MLRNVIKERGTKVSHDERDDESRNKEHAFGPLMGRISDS